MNNVSFTSKQNWQLDETVQPADANRWEKGIADVVALANYLNTTDIPNLQAAKVAKTGDTMTGSLTLNGGYLRVNNGQPIYLYGQSNFNIRSQSGKNELTILDGSNGAGVLIDQSQASQLYYMDADAKRYRFLDTRDKVTVTRGVSPNYAAAFTISSPYKATVPGWAMLRSGSGDWQNVSWVVNNTTFLSTGRKSYNTATCLTAFLDAGDTASFSASGGAAYFVPCKQL